MKSYRDLEKLRRTNSRTIRYVATGRSRRRKPVPVKAAVIFCVALVLLVAVISLNGVLYKSDFIPTWDSMYGGAGLSDGAGTALEGVSVHYIDVGQGDCELIVTPEKTVLIDCGEKEYYATVISYLKSLDIKRLDYVIITHPHSDHAGAASFVLDEFDIGTVIMPKLPDDLVPATSTYIRLLNVISDKGIDVSYAAAGTDISLGSGELKILSPVASADYEDLNNWSVAVKFVHGENSFLFTGDIEKSAEGDIIDSGADLTADVLKVAHHGSSTSSTKKFLNAVSPRYAVIEVGSPNTYNHPNDGTLTRLEKLGAEIYRTDQNGTIVFRSDGHTLTVTTEKTTAEAA